MACLVYIKRIAIVNGIREKKDMRGSKVVEGQRIKWGYSSAW